MRNSGAKRNAPDRSPGRRAGDAITGGVERACLTDAVDDRFETEPVLSADSDLVPPLRTIRARFPDKRVVAAFPPRRASFDLHSAAHAAFTIGEANLRHAQLPDTVVTPNGVDLHRPTTWR